MLCHQPHLGLCAAVVKDDEVVPIPWQVVQVAREEATGLLEGRVVVHLLEVWPMRADEVWPMRAEASRSSSRI